MDFAMTWYSFVFPNTALTTATFAVSLALHGDLATAPHFSRGTRPFQILGLVMTVGLILTWVFVSVMMIRAVVLKQILWPQKQEDRDEGGWGRDEAVRKGEIRSVWNSRQSSETRLGSHTVPTEKKSDTLASPLSEGQGHGYLVDATPMAESREALSAEKVDVEAALMLRANTNDGMFMKRKGILIRQGSQKGKAPALPEV